MMKTNSIYKTSLLAAALLLSATSCVKDELHDTPHPNTGKITVTADWSDRGDGVDIPAEWTVTMGGYTGTETGETHAPDYLFEPGSYTLAAYNTPEDITISGTTATVAPDSKVRVGQKEEFQGLRRRENRSVLSYMRIFDSSVTQKLPFSATLISNAPGWLMTSVQEVTVEADTDYELTAAMHQQVRQLTLVIEPTGDAAGRIESIEGSLCGAAGTLDFATGTYGAASDVVLHFTRITEGSDAGKWTATVRLLGITGNTQTLTATLTYADGNPADTSLESDLTAALADFNADKTVPLTLGGTIAETPTEAGVEAGITGWEKIDGGDVNADL